MNSRLVELRWSHKGVDWRFFRARGEIFPLELNDATYLIAVSLKNPKFSNRWLDEAVEGARAQSGRIVITLVDAPYLSSIEFGAMTTPERKSRLSKLTQQHGEQADRLSRLASKSDKNIEFIPWGDFQTATNDSLKRELLSAFERKGKVYELICQQVRTVFDEELAPADLRRFATFFLEETPTLVEAYYRLFNGCIDVYPGPQSPFFWELDRGSLAQELPIATAVALSGKPHTYAMFEV